MQKIPKAFYFLCACLHASSAVGEFEAELLAIIHLHPQTHARKRKVVYIPKHLHTYISAYTYIHIYIYVPLIEVVVKRSFSEGVIPLSLCTCHCSVSYAYQFAIVNELLYILCVSFIWFLLFYIFFHSLHLLHFSLVWVAFPVPAYSSTCFHLEWSFVVVFGFFIVPHVYLYDINKILIPLETLESQCTVCLKFDRKYYR